MAPCDEGGPVNLLPDAEFPNTRESDQYLRRPGRHEALLGSLCGRQRDAPKIAFKKGTDGIRTILLTSSQLDANKTRGLVH